MAVLDIFSTFAPNNVKLIIPAMKKTYILTRWLTVAVLCLIPLARVCAMEFTEEEWIKEKNADGIELSYHVITWIYINHAGIDADGNPAKNDTTVDCILINSDSYRYDIIGKLRIPEKVRDIPVQYIGSSAFSNCTLMTEVELPSSVTTIMPGAFSGCSRLETVTLTESFGGIGDRAFSGCSALRNITLPESLGAIGVQAFQGCSSLESIALPASLFRIDDYAFSGCTGLKEVKGLNLSIRMLGKGIFNNCPNLTDFDFSSATGTFPDFLAGNTNITSVVIPEGVTAISESAFSGCTSLRSATLPSTLTSIGKMAFYGCHSLEEVEGLDLSIDLGPYIFRGCSSLKGIDFSSLRGSIPDMAFAEWPGLESMVIPEGVTAIGGKEFENCYNLRSIAIPATVKEIRGSAFSGCASLTEVIIPDKVEEMGTNVFYNCTGLKKVSTPVVSKLMFQSCSQLEEVTLTGQLKVLPEYAFSDCSALKRINLPEGLTAIMNNAFIGCASLSEIHFPHSTKFIENEAFAGCTSLRTVYSLVSSPAAIPENSFTSVTKDEGTLYVPAGTRSLYEATAGWNFKTIVEMEEGQGIDAVANDNSEVTKGKYVYDLQGHRLNGQLSTVNGHWKGVYIRDGKKYVK